MKGRDVSRHIAFGGTRRAELRALYIAASHLPENDAVVEIGSAQGRATLVLAQTLCDGNGRKRIASVDARDRTLPFTPRATVGEGREGFCEARAGGVHRWSSTASNCGGVH